MKFLSWGKDGGKESHVWGLWFAEIKSLFSVVLLKFEEGTREAFHTHAFNSHSYVIYGRLQETEQASGDSRFYYQGEWIFTPREMFHQVRSYGTTWVLSFRGPWSKTWKEYIPAEDKHLTLTHGRQVVNEA